MSATNMSGKVSQHHYEHLLFGCVTEAELPALLHRLRGLCDYATTGGIPFLDREVGYKIGSFITLIDIGASLTCSHLHCTEAGNAITRVKVRQSLDEPEVPW